MQITLLLAVSFFNFGTGSVEAASTSACGQILANAEAAFQATLASDGSVPASPEAKAAAQEYIRVSKLCYEELESSSAGALQGETPTKIDDGGIRLENSSSAEFALNGTKWGSAAQGTPGGTITYSFMGNGISFSGEGFGNSVALTSLPNFQPCFITKIQNAFATWQVVANINFVQVTDNGAPFDSANAVGDIRIGVHAFDGPSGLLAHAYYPPPNGTSAAGDIHFDSAENWSCNTSGTDIGIVALHEIGHSLGLGHENTTTVAVMDPIYNSSITTLQADDINGVESIYGAAALSAPPVNDNFANASSKTVGSIPYTDTIDTTGATEEANDPQVTALCDGRFLNKGKKTVWYKYAPVSNIAVSLDTIGSDYDTYISVWKGSSLSNLTYVGCDDDIDSDLTSQLILNAVGGTTYYIEIAGYAGTSNPPHPESNPGGTLVFNVNLTNVNVFLGPSLIDRYYVGQNFSVRRSYANQDNGPQMVASVDGVTTILSSQRYIYSFMNSKSYAEMMGYPGNQLTTGYWFPWYNNVSYSTQLRVSNMGGNATTVKVYAGTTLLDSIPLSVGQGARKSYAADNGPLHVFSEDGVTPILASERFIQTFMSSASYSEMMGYPGNQLATEYWFPWYNNLNYSTQLRVSNLGGTSAEIKVFAGGTNIDTFTLAPGEGARKSYAQDNGPLLVKSTDGVTPIIASERFIYTYGSSASYAEMMGYPTGQLTAEYCFPRYNSNFDGDVILSSQLRVSNMGGAGASVKVYLAGSEIDTLSISTGQGVRKSYPGLNDGPLCVVSTTVGVPILASLRFISTYLDSASYSEMMGYPSNQLAPSYWFPWYNNISYSTELRLSKP
jgi:hypothetical protein